MDVGLLIIRAAIGLILLASGQSKIGGRAASARTRAEFGALGLRPPRAMALLAGSLQATGGLLFCTGIMTAVAASCVAVTMAVAIWCIGTRHGFFSRGCEYPWVLLLTSIGLAFTGPGGLALSRYVAESGGGTLAGTGAAVLAAMALPAARAGGFLHSTSLPAEKHS